MVHNNVFRYRYGQQWSHVARVIPKQRGIICQQKASTSTYTIDLLWLYPRAKIPLAIYVRLVSKGSVNFNEWIGVVVVMYCSPATGKVYVYVLMHVKIIDQTNAHARVMT